MRVQIFSVQEMYLTSFGYIFVRNPRISDEDMIETEDIIETWSKYILNSDYIHFIHTFSTLLAMKTVLLYVNDIELRVLAAVTVRNYHVYDL